MGLSVGFISGQDYIFILKSLKNASRLDASKAKEASQPARICIANNSMNNGHGRTCSFRRLLLNKPISAGAVYIFKRPYTQIQAQSMCTQSLRSPPKTTRPSSRRSLRNGKSARPDKPLGFALAFDCGSFNGGRVDWLQLFIRRMISPGRIKRAVGIFDICKISGGWIFRGTRVIRLVRFSLSRWCIS